jgi:hypothetical protein
MRTRTSNFVLAYQRLEEQRRESSGRFWSDIAEVVVYSAVWAIVGTVVAALVGAVLLWGVLLTSVVR